MLRSVWLSGNSGAGKTFIGDYLSQLCGFAHLDGDAPLFSGDAAARAAFASFVAAFDFWFESSPAPPALWQPYLARQCAAVRAAHGGSSLGQR